MAREIVYGIIGFFVGFLAIIPLAGPLFPTGSDADLLGFFLVCLFGGIVGVALFVEFARWMNRKGSAVLERQEKSGYGMKRTGYGAYVLMVMPAFGVTVVEAFVFNLLFWFPWAQQSNSHFLIFVLVLQTVCIPLFSWLSVLYVRARKMVISHAISYTIGGMLLFLVTDTYKNIVGFVRSPVAFLYALVLVAPGLFVAYFVIKKEMERQGLTPEPFSVKEMGEAFVGPAPK